MEEYKSTRIHKMVTKTGRYRGRTVNVGQELFFIVDPENSRHATNVGVCVPPQCGE